MSAAFAAAFGRVLQGIASPLNGEDCLRYCQALTTLQDIDKNAFRTLLDQALPVGSSAPDSAPVESNSSAEECFCGDCPECENERASVQGARSLRSIRNGLTGKIAVDRDNVLDLVYRDERSWVPLDEVKCLVNRVERIWRA